jgi:hypothetical protein
VCTATAPHAALEMLKAAPWQQLMKRVSDPYRPELHDMHGQDPKRLGNRRHVMRASPQGRGRNP